MDRALWHRRRAPTTMVNYILGSWACLKCGESHRYHNAMAFHVLWCPDTIAEAIKYPRHLDMGYKASGQCIHCGDAVTSCECYTHVCRHCGEPVTAPMRCPCSEPMMDFLTTANGLPPPDHKAWRPARNLQDSHSNTRANNLCPACESAECSCIPTDGRREETQKQPRLALGKRKRPRRQPRRVKPKGPRAGRRRKGQNAVSTPHLNRRPPASLHRGSLLTCGDVEKNPGPAAEPAAVTGNGQRAPELLPARAPALWPSGRESACRVELQW